MSKIKAPPSTVNVYPLDDLLECQLEGISFPITNLHTVISHDVVEHKFPYVDEAKLEQMGRNSLSITFTAVFFNTISPSKNETWTQGQLYPSTHAKFMLTCSDGKNKVFQHPELGFLNVKVISATSNILANVRGGATVDVTLKTTIVNNTTQTTSNLAISASKLNQVANQLDTSITGLLNPDPHTLFPTYYSFNMSFGDMALEVLTLLTQTQFFSEALISILNQIQFLSLSIIQECEDQNNVVLAVIKNNAYNMYSLATLSMNDPTIIKKPQKVKTKFRIKTPTTLSQLATEFNNSITDIMSLNPTLISNPIIPVGTIIYYFS